MKAIISGRAGLAVITEGNSTRTLYIDEGGGISERPVSDPGSLLRDVEDLEVFNSVTADRVSGLLAFARQREDALQMVLILLSRRSSETVREEAGAVLDQLLSEDGRIQGSVERILYAASLPSAADVAGAMDVCERGAARRSAEMISRLVARQPYIADVRQEWDALASSFASREELLGFQAVLVWEGVFRELVESLAADVDLNQFVFKTLSNNRVTKQRNHRDVIGRWVMRWRSQEHATPAQVPVSPDEARLDDETEWRDRAVRRPKAEEILERVKRPKAFITQALHQGRIGSARQYIDDLIRYHEKFSDKEHICRSLCDLAKEARNAGLRDLQLELVERAIEYDADDVVARSQRGDALKGLNRLPEALEAYEQAMAQHPSDAVSRGGAACVLASMGHWEQALALLPQGAPVTTNDWIACHIRGMIYLRRGKVDEAIEIFENGVAHNPLPASREYFRTALAVAYLRRREYQRAVSVLDEVAAPTLQSCANVLRLHAFGAQGDCTRTVEIYRQLPENPEPVLAELQQELHRRYVLFATPEHDESWLFEKEADYILLAA